MRITVEATPWRDKAPLEDLAFPGAEGRKTITHPEMGRPHVNCDVLTVLDDDQQVVFITAAPGTPSARALRHLLPTG